MNEADTCRKYVVPALQSAGWDDAPHRINEQVIFTDGRITVANQVARRQKGKKPDYILRYRPDIPIAVVEAKSDTSTVGEGMQQAKDYAEILGLKFAYATNGIEILEFDYTTGIERLITAYPTPDELWFRLCQADKITDETEKCLLSSSYALTDKPPRYYQEIAINRTIQSVLQKEKRILLTMATGTGKTFVAFQICWKLWNSRWNKDGSHRRPRILYLSDRNILIDDPKDKTFAPFGDARWKIENGEAIKSREMYFAIYQAIARDEKRPGLYREYDPSFFDLIIVDECHRGSARDTSNWREILEYFQPAYQIGMTATPQRQDNRNTYRYFGDPIYTYSLRQGIEDGFLAPYRVHRVITAWDAKGWRPSKGDLDRYGREIPDTEYHTYDFERVVALRARTEAVARHITAHLKATDRFAKTIVFCVDQEHADEMRRALNNLNADLVQQYPDYVCRVTSDEGDIGKGHLSNFQDVERQTPVILTTSQLLTTGVDAPTVKNIALVRVINSMTEFKQIIGRGTRVRDDYNKLFFYILDYTGSATRQFNDPDFDGDPAEPPFEVAIGDGTDISELEISREVAPHYTPSHEDTTNGGKILLPPDPAPVEPRKYYFDSGQVEIAAHLVYELEPSGKRLRVVTYTDYTAGQVRSLYRNAAELRSDWANPNQRKEIIDKLAQRGIDCDELAKISDQPDADPLDLICHLAFNAPVRTRKERTQKLRNEKRDFFEQFGPDARQVLDELLDKYTDHGTTQFVIPDVLEVPPINQHGNVLEIAKLFGGADKLRDVVNKLQTLLYAA